MATIRFGVRTDDSVGGLAEINAAAGSLTFGLRPGSTPSTKLVEVLTTTGAVAQYHGAGAGGSLDITGGPGAFASSPVAGYTLLSSAGSLLIDFSGLRGVTVADIGLGLSALLERCKAEGATLVGSTKADTLYGGAAADRLEGGRGDDYLRGLGNDDFLLGGAGDDRLDGGAGSDTVSYEQVGRGVSISLAKRGAQSVPGEGRDTLVAIENLLGTRFDDTLVGDSRANVLTGGAGNDRLDGGAGADTAGYTNASRAVTVSLALRGAQNTRGAGTDELTRIENLLGSRFGDRLSGDRGDNVLTGGAGNDRLDGAGGQDTAAYDTASGGVRVSLALQGLQDTEGAGRDSLRNIERLRGSRHADVLTGDAKNNLLEGGGGADLLKGGAGNDVLLGGLGDDRLIGGAGNDTLDGGAGVDLADYAAVGADLTATQLSGGRLLIVGVGSDVLKDIESIAGGAGDDHLRGNAQILRLSGGDGHDTLDMAAADLGVGQQVLLEGGRGDDVLLGRAGSSAVWASYAGAADAVTVDLGLALAQNTGGAGTDTLMNITNLLGSAFDDLLVANAEVNVIDGGGGADTVSYAGATGPVDIDLAAGVGTEADHVDSLRNIRHAVGSSFADTLVGDTAENRLDGGAGSDTVSYRYHAGVTVDLSLTGAQAVADGDLDTLIGIENLLGSVGDDVLAGDAGDNVLDGDAGVDRVSYAGATVGVVVSLALVGPQDTGGAGVDRLAGFENLTGSALGDDLAGDGGDNALAGGAGDDRLSGGGGDDTLTGEADNDSLSGDVGDDTLSGDAGDDELRGGAGVDNLTGGAGADRFVFTHNDAADLLLDFLSGIDSLVFDRDGFPAFATAGVLGSEHLLLLGDTPAGGDDFLIYDQASGSLFYDDSGSGTLLHAKIAELGPSATLNAFDILII